MAKWEGRMGEASGRPMLEFEEKKVKIRSPKAALPPTGLLRLEFEL
jgi:hypothetical protein